MFRMLILSLFGLDPGAGGLPLRTDGFLAEVFLEQAEQRLGTIIRNSQLFQDIFGNNY